MKRIFVFLAIAALASTENASAQTVETELEAIQQSLVREGEREHALDAEADQLTVDIRDLRDTLVEAAASVQRHQVELDAIEQDLATIEEVEAEKSDALDLSRADLASSLVALARLGRRKPEALALMPQAWASATRSARLLRYLVPALRDRADRLVGDLADLAEVRLAKAEALKTQATIAAEINRERNRLELLLRRKSKSQASVVAQKSQIALKVGRLAEQAEDLRDLVAALAAAPPPGEIAPPSLAEDEMWKAPTEDGDAALADGGTDAGPEDIEINEEIVVAVTPGAAVPLPQLQPNSSLPYPAHGRIVVGYGEKSGDNPASLGMTIETSSKAQVIAPMDGLVVFAGPFRSYGELLIIEYSDEYHILLSGFSRIDSREGEWLRAGEPVGIMGPDSEQPPLLYVEVRRSGQPINPDVWLASNIRKVSG